MVGRQARASTAIKISRRKRRIDSNGFAYLGLLFIIAILGVVSAGASALWSIDQKRQKEKELLFIGNQYRQAIASYYEHSPGAVKQYPQTWEDLLGDNRFIVPMRHLRKIYRDPITLAKDWGLMRGPDGGIAGVYSTSIEEPMKKGNFDEANAEFTGKATYRDWRFIYLPSSSKAVNHPRLKATGLRIPDGGL